MDQQAVMNSMAPAIIQELENRLQARLSGRVRGLQIIHFNCGIILRGVTQTYHAKQVAQHALMAETSVPILANEIEVC